MLNGGLIPQRTYIITGLPGSGKTTLGIQFLLQGLKQGERVLFVAVDEPPNEIKFNYSRFSWDAGELKILDANSDIRRLEPTPVLDITSKSMVSRVSEIQETIRKTPDFESVIVTIHSLQQAIKQITDREKCSRLVIDSMSGVKYFCMEGLDESMSTQSFMRFLAELKTTTLLMLETGESVPLTPELFLARGEIRMHKWWSAGMLHRGISVELIRGARHDETIRPMEITSAGISVYPGIGDWKRKTGRKAKKYSDEDRKRLRAELEVAEKALEDTKGEFKEGELDISEVRTVLSSAKYHMEKGELLYAFELTSYCQKMLDEALAVPNSIRHIVLVESLLTEQKAMKKAFPDVDELLKRAKDCVNKNQYTDALKHAQECESILQKMITQEEEAFAEDVERETEPGERGDAPQAAAIQPVLDEVPSKMTCPESHIVDSEKERAQPAQARQAEQPAAAQAATTTAGVQERRGPVSAPVTPGEPSSPPVQPPAYSKEPAPKPSKAETKPVGKEPPAQPPRKHERKSPGVEQKLIEAQSSMLSAAEAISSDRSAVLAQELMAQEQPSPSNPSQPQTKQCPQCMRELSYIQQYTRWYCYTCKKYAPKDI